MPGWITPVVLIKIVFQPAVTLVVLVLLDQPRDVWFAAAVIMAAQPIGAGAYVFSRKYDFFDEETSLSIVVSLVLTLVTLTVMLQCLAPA